MKRRLFVGIDVPPATKKALGKMKSQLEPLLPGMRWESETKYHVTLAFLGSTAVSPQKIISSLTKKLQRFSRFSMLLTEVGLLYGKTTVLTVEIEKSEPILRLYHMITNELELIGFAKHSRYFHPHLTLGRSPRSIAKLPQVELDQQLLVTSVTLFESQLTPDGSTYRPLGEIFLLPIPLV